MPSSKISCPGYGGEGVEPHPGARHDSSMSPLSREPPAAVGGLSAQPVGAVSFPSHSPSLVRVWEGPSSVAPKGVSGQQGQ